VIDAIIIGLFALCYAVIAYRRAEEEKLRNEQEERKRAQDQFSKALTQTGIANLVAFGDFYGAVGAETPDLQSALVARETAKWRALNAGLVLAKALVGSASVTTLFSTDGSVRLDVTTGICVGLDLGVTIPTEPYTTKSFQLTQPSPDTAILRYQVERGWLVGEAMAIWTKREGGWVTASYQATRK
jgi:hypothetical protein